MQKYETTNTGDTIPHVLTYLMPNLASIAFFGRFLFTRSAVIVICTLGISYPLSLYRDIEKLSKASALALIRCVAPVSLMRRCQR